MKATFNEIVENLVKVLTDKAESAQYYSDNDQYICLCGWCGTMSPVSRPAYYKTFGKDTTEAAEAKAREIIAEREAARQRTKYAEHAQEADRLEGVPAVGGFFWADNSGLKCDGGRGLFEELHALNYYTHAAEKPARLCCVGQIIRVSDEDFARPALADELVQARALNGFCRSEDVDDKEDVSAVYNDPEKLATFYTVGALVVSPSGKYYLIDSEGYNYARYIYVPIEWPELLADEVAAVKAEENARKAEEERQEAEAKAQRLAQYRARCAKWSHLMQDVRPLEADPKTTSRQLMNARKANILAMCRAAFPGVKFSLKVRHGWGADFELTWTDGPTVEEFNKKTDLALFCRCRDTFDGWDDSTGVDYAEFADFARLTMGSNGGDIKTKRVMSDEARAELLAQIFAVVPAADRRNKYGYTEAYTYTNKEAEAVAAALGVDVLDIFACGYSENAETIARRAWNMRSYTKTTTPEPTDPKPGKAQADDSTDTTDEAPAEGLELVETAEGVAVVGDSRTTYRNRKQIKAHGAKWNKEAQQWQASEPGAVANLLEWFGVSFTPTAEEGDTANENEPQGDETAAQGEHTHTTESDSNSTELTETDDTEPTETDSTTAQTGADATLYEAGEITDTAPTPTADRLALLHYVAADIREGGRFKTPLDALRARLYALNALGVEVFDLMTLAGNIQPESVGERSATSCALEAIQRLSSTADRRAAEVLTPEDFRTLYGYGKEDQPENRSKVWQFERGTKDANGYELHEIRRVPSGFMVFFNVCEATGGGCSTMAVYPTYCAALEVLTRCRPGAQLIAESVA